MSGREVREYTNLSDPKDKKWGTKGGRADKTDDEDLAFKRMVAKMQEVAGERGGYLHGRGALDSDDLLYLKEQMEAEEDAERLRRRTEKRAFAAFKKAASLADSVPSTSLPQIRVEPKPRSGIRQQTLLKSLVEVKPKRIRVVSPSAAALETCSRSCSSSKFEEQTHVTLQHGQPDSDEKRVGTSADDNLGSDKPQQSTSLLGLAYGSSSDDDSEGEECRDRPSRCN